MWRFWVPVGLVLASIVYGVLSVEFFRATSTLEGARNPTVLAVFYAMAIVPGAISMAGLVAYRMGQTYIGGAVLFVLPIMLLFLGVVTLFAPGPKMVVTSAFLLAAAIIAVRRRYDGQDDPAT